MPQSKDGQLYDNRTLKQRERDGSLDHKTYQQHIKSLPDSSANAEYFQVDLEPSLTTTPSQVKGDSPKNRLTFSPVETDA